MIQSPLHIKETLQLRPQNQFEINFRSTQIDYQYEENVSDEPNLTILSFPWGENSHSCLMISQKQQKIFYFQMEASLKVIKITELKDSSNFLVSQPQSIASQLLFSDGPQNKIGIFVTEEKGIQVFTVTTGQDFSNAPNIQRKQYQDINHDLQSFYWVQPNQYLFVNNEENGQKLLQCADFEKVNREQEILLNDQNTKIASTKFQLNMKEIFYILNFEESKIYQVSEIDAIARVENLPFLHGRVEWIYDKKSGLLFLIGINHSKNLYILVMDLNSEIVKQGEFEDQIVNENFTLRSFSAESKKDKEFVVFLEYTNTVEIFHYEFDFKENKLCQQQVDFQPPYHKFGFNHFISSQQSLLYFYNFLPNQTVQGEIANYDELLKNTNSQKQMVSIFQQKSSNQIFCMTNEIKPSIPVFNNQGINIVPDTTYQTRIENFFLEGMPKIQREQAESFSTNIGSKLQTKLNSNQSTNNILSFAQNQAIGSQIDENKGQSAKKSAKSPLPNLVTTDLEEEEDIQSQNQKVQYLQEDIQSPQQTNNNNDKSPDSYYLLEENQPNTEDNNNSMIKKLINKQIDVSQQGENSSIDIEIINQLIEQELPSSSIQVIPQNNEADEYMQLNQNLAEIEKILETKETQPILIQLQNRDSNVVQETQADLKLAKQDSLQEQNLEAIQQQKQSFESLKCNESSFTSSQNNITNLKRSVLLQNELMNERESIEFEEIDDQAYKQYYSDNSKQNLSHTGKSKNSIKSTLKNKQKQCKLKISQQNIKKSGESQSQPSSTNHKDFDNINDKNDESESEDILKILENDAQLQKTIHQASEDPKVSNVLPIPDATVMDSNLVDNQKEREKNKEIIQPIKIQNQRTFKKIERNAQNNQQNPITQQNSYDTIKQIYDNTTIIILDDDDDNDRAQSQKINQECKEKKHQSLKQQEIEKHRQSRKLSFSADQSIRKGIKLNNQNFKVTSNNSTSTTTSTKQEQRQFESNLFEQSNRLLINQVNELFDPINMNLNSFNKQAITIDMIEFQFMPKNQNQIEVSFKPSDEIEWVNYTIQGTAIRKIQIGNRFHIIWTNSNNLKIINHNQKSQEIKQNSNYLEKNNQIFINQRDNLLVINFYSKIMKLQDLNKQNSTVVEIRYDEIFIDSPQYLFQQVVFYINSFKNEYQVLIKRFDHQSFLKSNDIYQHNLLWEIISNENFEARKSSAIIDERSSQIKEMKMSLSQIVAQQNFIKFEEIVMKNFQDLAQSSTCDKISQFYQTILDKTNLRQIDFIQLNTSLEQFVNKILKSIRDVNEHFYYILLQTISFA